MNESVFAWMNVKATNIFTRKKRRKKRRGWSNLHPTGKKYFFLQLYKFIEKSALKIHRLSHGDMGRERAKSVAFCRNERGKNRRRKSTTQVKMQMTMAAPRIIPYFSIKRHLFLFVSARNTGRVIPPRAKSVPSIRDHLALLPLFPRERRKEGEEEEDDRSRPPRWWKRCDNRKLASIKFFVSFEIGGGTNLAAKHKEPSLSLSILCFLVSLYSLSVSLCFSLFVVGWMGRVVKLASEAYVTIRR